MAASPTVLRSRVLARAVTSSLRRGLLGAHANPPSSLLVASPRPAAVHRLPSVCGGLLSVMPLHSAVASARLRSAIAPESQSWGIVPQGLDTMSSFTMCSLLQTVAGSTATERFSGARYNEMTEQRPLHRAVRCCATQTQNIQRKTSTATIQGADPKGKVNGSKLDDGSGGFPPFCFGKGGGGGGGGGGANNYFGGFFLFACVLLLDYLKEIEKNMLLQRHGTGNQASMGLA